MAITPDGKRADVANDGDGTVSAITIATVPGRPLSRLAAFRTPWLSVLRERAGLRGQLGREHGVGVSPTATGLVTPITVGNNPNFGEFTADGSSVDVTNFGDCAGSAPSAITGGDGGGVGPDHRGQEPARRGDHS